jgi:hypothetical protein
MVQTHWCNLMPAKRHDKERDHTPSNRSMPRMCLVGLIENRDDMIAISISHHLLPFLSVIQYPEDFRSGAHGILAQALLWPNCFRFLSQEART